MPKNPRSGKYEVGYGKPPQHTQFQPGQSGNPRGRPKKAHSLQEVLAKKLQRKVTITVDGKSQKVSTLEAITLNLVVTAAKGNLKAQALVFQQLNSQPPASADLAVELGRELRAVYARIQPGDDDARTGIQRTTTEDSSDAEV